MKRIFTVIHLLVLSVVFFFISCATTHAAPPQALKGEATGAVLLNGEPWGTGKVSFYNVGGDASFVVTCEKDVSAGANSATCIGTDVQGFFSGGPSGYALFGSGSDSITLNLTSGETFSYAQGGVTAEFKVSDPSIFNNWGQASDDENQFEPEEYDPDAPLTDSNARASEIDGQAEIACPPDFDTWNVLKKNTIIYNHCRLKTGEQSTLKISFGTMSTFVMRPETEVTVNEATKEKTIIQLFFGGFWANVKKMAKGEEFRFKGSQAVAGIKGTTFIMEDTGTSTTLKVIEGDVEFMDSANGKTETVRTGEALTADAEGLGQKSEFDTNNENKIWQEITHNFPQTKGPQTNDFRFNYALLIPILAAVIGGGWVVKKRKTGNLK